MCLVMLDGGLQEHLVFAKQRLTFHVRHMYGRVPYLAIYIQILSLMPSPVIYMASALLGLAVLPLPYGFYTFVKIVTTAVFTWAAVIEYRQNTSPMMIWILVLVAILFNPIILIHLTRETWQLLDIMALIILVTHRKRAI